MLPVDYGIELGGRYPSVKFFSASDKSVVRDYPDRLHSYYTTSEDFHRAALDFVEMDREKVREVKGREVKVREVRENGEIIESDKIDESDLFRLY